MIWLKVRAFKLRVQVTALFLLDIFHERLRLALARDSGLLDVANALETVLLLLDHALVDLVVLRLRHLFHHFLKGIQLCLFVFSQERGPVLILIKHVELRIEELL